jgi:regulator of sigma E protease
MDMVALSGLGDIAVVILAFSALIFVHELGHFLAAKMVGVRVERFFLGFHPWVMAISK